MEEIKVGEYYRTKNGLIRKVETIKSGKRQFTRTTETLVNGRHKLEDIKKYRKNIIDLIEVGDYVNGEIVIDIGERGLYLGYADDNEHYSRISIDESEINSIVTKEVFKNAEYRVETN